MADDKEKEKEKEPFFKLYNLDAVEKIKRDEKIELPQRKLSIPKDERWNEKQMASKTMQGILNGDSIKTISKSMEEVVKNNEVSAMRIARTMHTSAENAGRLQSFKDLAEQGVVQKKVWQATPDDRVRASHLDIDGEEQDIDKPFSNGCMFPGDGKGPSDEVWNCRCAMSDHIIGFRRKDGSISEVKYKGEETLHDKQIREERTRRGTTAAKSSTPKASSTVVNGKDITDTWTRREDKFDFEIEDVINAQGFDGKPRVVDAEEFEKAVKESNVIMQRGYRAPNQEILKEYQDTLYKGKWYVDCSSGGSIYGKGMYTVYNKGTEIIDDIADTAKDYARPNIFTGLTAGTIETMTLVPDAKIIKYEEIKDMLFEYNKTHSKLDEGSLAALYGYDAISVGQNDMGYLVILNRTKVIIKENTL